MSMNFKTLDSINLHSKKVLLRVDLNVPTMNGKVMDATRITSIIPTIKLILKKKGFPILLSHFGRPAGRIDGRLSLKMIAPVISKLLGHPVFFSDDTVGNRVQKLIEDCDSNAVVLLENLRFLPGEENNDPSFAKSLAKLGDVFCNDAFSVCHRAHASTVGLANCLPSCVGPSVVQELEALDKALTRPRKPIVAVVGGAKVSTKIKILKNLIKKVDHIIIGGGMANTFLYAKGFPVGASLCEKDFSNIAREIQTEADTLKCKIHLPKDIVCAKEFNQNTQYSIFDSNLCPENLMILDAGPKTIKNIKSVFSQSKTLIWNGPLGAFELQPFDNATNITARFAAELTERNLLISIAGGGDTVAAFNSAGVNDNFSYLSSAGGAFLEWLEGKTLPGLTALEYTKLT